MNIETNRREFMKAAAIVIGAAEWTGSSFAANAADTGSRAPAGTSKPDAGSETPKSSGEVPLAPPDKQPPNLPVPEPAPRKIGWAIVGLGELALEEVMPAFLETRLSKPVALVSGHPEKARKIAEAYGVKPEAIYNYENYDQLAQNKEVEVIYIILPNSMHAEFTIRGLRAGKHVLCEKPMAPSVEECEQMIAVSKETGKKLMIAYRLHYEPMNLTVAELLRKQTFGPVKTLSSSNCQNTPAPNIRLSKKLGGGPIGDIGIYSINTARMILGEEPVEVSAMFHQPKDNPRFREVPESATFTLRFPSGVLAHCDCSFNSTESRRYRVHCEKGFVEMDPAFSYRGLRLRVKQGESKGGTPQLAEWNVKEVNQFAAEMDHFSECVLQDKLPRTPGEEGLQDMRIIAAIEEAARTGQTVRIG
ncbi:MAG: Gfo/Idh/MocA family oxidoreductase [Verrucomicrobiaceae bacterium]|nr:MAG: Gfo/Idh/MocA family oxidoreductase [Verrucomicrobiaceae bacterium]